VTLARRVITLGLGGIGVACKIEPIETLEVEEPVTIELPGTVQPLELPRLEAGRERDGEPAWVSGGHEGASLRRLVAAVGPDVVLPLQVLWVLAGRLEAPSWWSETEPPTP
jgi:hypothetical protein